MTRFPLSSAPRLVWVCHSSSWGWVVFGLFGFSNCSSLLLTPRVPLPYPKEIVWVFRICLSFLGAEQHGLWVNCASFWVVAFLPLTPYFAQSLLKGVRLIRLDVWSLLSFIPVPIEDGRSSAQPVRYCWWGCVFILWVLGVFLIIPSLLLICGGLMCWVVLFFCCASAFLSGCFSIFPWGATGTSSNFPHSSLGFCCTNL